MSKSPSAKVATPESFLATVRNGTPLPPALLLTGADSIRHERFLEALLGESGRDGWKRVDAADINARGVEQLRSETQNLGLFATSARFRIVSLDELKAALHEAFADLVQVLASPTLLVASAASLPAQSPLRKAFARHAPSLDFPPFEHDELAKWVSAELRRSGVATASREVIEALILVGDSLPDRIAKACEHLALYVDGGEPTVESIGVLFSSKSHHSDFELLDALASGSAARSAIVIRQLLDAGRSPFLLLGMMQRAFGQYLEVVAGRSERLPQDAVRARLGVPPWLFQKIARSAGNYTLERLRVCHYDLLRADTLLKNRSLGADAVLEELAGRLAP